ncbi:MULTISPECIES: ArsR/SmtB family transcription factor [Sphingomonas]|uniref:Metalloregulator ArsR/SmtB family transcription factor n=1 Tax=Sphingomonas lycopersici TaxID=2951807 RepID=A0AA41ZIL1_9SPHN|nr:MULTISPECIES: metalloregulator ArsR/SmtB family transcription factor [Sphingomonas]MCW6530619.1 metalloregulator ArsR/SmtB family transcription factor [Sphingomonas lycopersici]MCW6536368.1 metalloregulator ArsR/SmtB family transcription factor [Sphingomonas lycopersici]OJU14755.1 MAG: ArsR family transcriptional regulator [Sphingomonas sp. 66-10]
MIDALEIFRALADSSRLRIVRLLRTMELSVGELAQVLGQSQPRVSRHVKILCDAGLAERRKEGSWVFVALGPADAVAPVAAALDGWDAASPDRQAAADVARLAAVRADRAASAAAWFEANAGQWDAIRSLHIAEEQVEEAMLAALGDAPVGRLIDIGTGTGRMIELFAPRAETALGIDRSSEMLRLARAKLGEQGLANVELRQADLYALPMGDGEADVAIIHHVLHFAQQPGAAIAEAARVLAPGGRLLIADFAPHDREELRAQDAHTRLGFSDAQIERWFAAAGLTLAQVETLAGGELTVKLWLGVRHGAALKEVKAA